MRQLGLFMGLVVTLAVATAGYAQDKRWADEAELSFVDTGGNTEVSTLSAKNLLKYTFSERWLGSLKLAVLRGESDGERNAENYLAEVRLDYLFTDRAYSSAIAGWSKDQFAGIDSRLYVGPAVGYKFWTGPKHLLLAEAGLYQVNEQYTDDTDEDYIEGRAFSQYEYVLTDRNKFSQSLEFLYNFEESKDWNLNSETAVISALNHHLSLKTSYVIKYDNRPVPSTLEETDTILGVTLVVSF